MADYANALNLGLDALAEAMRARVEIERVFEDLNVQISTNDIKIQIKELEINKPSKTIDWLQRMAEQMTSVGVSSAPKETYWALVAVNSKVEKSPEREIASWKQDRRGYPCSIDF